MTTKTAGTRNRRGERVRKELFARLEELSYRIASLDRRIDPGYSSQYIPGPADASDRAMRNAEGAREQKQQVLADLYWVAWAAWTAGAKISAINAAAARTLFSWEAYGWDHFGQVTDSRLLFDGAMVEQVRADARAEFPEFADARAALFADRLAAVGHVAERAFRLTAEEII